MATSAVVRWVVGVAGASGSGKTSLAEAVAARLGPDVATVLAHDAYYRRLSPAERADVAHHDFDAPDALDHDLLVAHVAALRAGRDVEVPVYAFDVHDRVGTASLAPRPVLVVEGILLLAVPAVRACLDVAVFVDTPLSQCLHRRIARDAVERGRTEASVRAQWAHTVAPAFARWVGPSRAHADLVVDGEADLAGSVTDVLSRLPPTLRGAR